MEIKTNQTRKAEDINPLLTVAKKPATITEGFSELKAGTTRAECCNGGKGVAGEYLDWWLSVRDLKLNAGPHIRLIM